MRETDAEREGFKVYETLSDAAKRVRVLSAISISDIRRIVNAGVECH